MAILNGLCVFYQQLNSVTRNFGKIVTLSCVKLKTERVYFAA